MEANYSRDHIVILNNYLQRHPSGNLASDLVWTLMQEGPANQTIHTAVATYRGVVVGQGKGTSKAVAKSMAASQALEYLQKNGTSRDADPRLQLG